MEKTQKDRHVGAQGLPGALRGWPAIRIDRLGGIIGLQGPASRAKTP